eukprot:3489329-Prymnesium_polylepis.1
MGPSTWAGLSEYCLIVIVIVPRHRRCDGCDMCVRALARPLPSHCAPWVDWVPYNGLCLSGPDSHSGRTALYPRTKRGTIVEPKTLLLLHPYCYCKAVTPSLRKRLQRLITGALHSWSGRQNVRCCIHAP